MFRYLPNILRKHLRRADSNPALTEARYGVNRILADVLRLDEAFSQILETLCTGLDWNAGCVWLTDEEPAPLHLFQVWEGGDSQVRSFYETSGTYTFQPGIGLPGRVYQNKKASWITDVTEDSNFPRGDAARDANLHGSIAFPLLHGQKFYGVLEFFARKVRPPDSEMLSMFDLLGAQIGQYLDKLRTIENREAIIRSALDCIVSMDHQGRITEFNPAAEATFGYTREEALGRLMGETIVPPRLREAHDQGMKRYLATNDAHVLGKRIELNAMRKGGEEFPVELTITKIPGRGNISFTGFIRDITERKRLEDELAKLLRKERELRSEAEVNSRIKDEFLATLSHELRTPLNAILGWAKLLRKRKVAPDQIDKGLEIIERNALAQAQLIEDLLDMNRIVSGKMRLDLVELEPVQLLRDAIETVRPAADLKRIEIELAVAEALPPINADPSRLRQIIWNLLSNSIKFTPPGGKITVRAAHSGSGTEFTVADTGEGILPEFLPYVFEKFRQADSALTRAHGGLGLGLAIVRNLVELHGGTVDVASRGKSTGAVFTVRLPQTRQISRDQEKTTREAAESAPWEPASLQDLTVLLVEDHIDAQALVTAILNDCGASVVVASSAAEGVIKFRNHRPDIIVSDIGMPGEDGYKFLREIRELERNEGHRTPAVALTALARPEDRRNAMDAGFEVHIAKPVDPKGLVEIVERLTREKAGR